MRRMKYRIFTGRLLPRLGFVWRFYVNGSVKDLVFAPYQDVISEELARGLLRAPLAFLMILIILLDRSIDYTSSRS